MLNVECRMMNVESDELIRQPFCNSTFSIQHSTFFYYDQEAFHLIYMYVFVRHDFHQL